MVVNSKGDPLISGKSRLVKYYPYHPCMVYLPTFAWFVWWVDHWLIHLARYLGWSLVRPHGTWDTFTTPSLVASLPGIQRQQNGKSMWICFFFFTYIPSRELTYPTWGKGKSSSNILWVGIYKEFFLSKNTAHHLMPSFANFPHFSTILFAPFF